MCSVNAECAEPRDLRGHVGVARDEHATLCCGEVLDRVERKTACISKEPDMEVVAPCSDGKRAILDHAEVMLGRELHDLAHCAGNAEEVHDCERLRPLGDQGADR